MLSWTSCRGWTRPGWTEAMVVESGSFNFCCDSKGLRTNDARNYLRLLLHDGSSMAAKIHKATVLQ